MKSTMNERWRLVVVAAVSTAGMVLDGFAGISNATAAQTADAVEGQVPETPCSAACPQTPGASFDALIELIQEFDVSRDNGEAELSLIHGSGQTVHQVPEPSVFQRLWSSLRQRFGLREGKSPGTFP